MDVKGIEFSVPLFPPGPIKIQAVRVLTFFVKRELILSHVPQCCLCLVVLGA
jgi:hypothetical protein